MVMITRLKFQKGVKIPKRSKNSKKKPKTCFHRMETQVKEIVILQNSKKKSRGHSNKRALAEGTPKKSRGHSKRAL
jgi:hypothetical protein